jgi:hypothetical protein
MEYVTEQRLQTVVYKLLPQIATQKQLQESVSDLTQLISKVREELLQEFDKQLAAARADLESDVVDLNNQVIDLAQEIKYLERKCENK